MLSFVTLAKRTPVGIASTYSGQVAVRGWDDGYVGAKGTCAIDEERSAEPLNVSDITCFRDQRTCYSAHASVGGITSQNWLDVELGVFSIVRWESSSIEYQAQYLCMTTKYVIDRATEKVSGRRLRTPGSDDKACGDFSQDLRVGFVNGSEVATPLRREAAPTTAGIIVATIFSLLMFVWAVRVITRKA